MIGVNSKSLPSLAGIRRFVSVPYIVLPADPWTTSTQASRVREAAAVWRSGVIAGTIDSRNGNPTTAPMPRRTVRREICLFAINMRLSPRYLLMLLYGCVIVPRHLEQRTLYNSHNKCRETVITLGRIPRNGSDQRHIAIIQHASDAIGEKVLAKVAQVCIRVLHHSFADADGSIQLRTFIHGSRRIDHKTTVLGAPQSDGIVVFERHANRIHDLVTGRTRWVRAMLDHAFANTENL